MKRILVYGMTSNRGGIEAYLMTYFRILSKNEDIVFDFVSEHNPIAYEDEVKELGGKIHYIPSRRENLLKHMMGIRRILKENREYEVFYANILSASECFTVIAAKGLNNVKTVVHSHNGNVKNIKKHLILRPILNMFTDMRLSCAKPAAEFMFGKKMAKSVPIINNAIQLEKYSYNAETRQRVRESFGIEDETVIGHVGRFCYQKNSLYVIDVFAKYLQKDKNAKLLLVGDGEDRQQVEKKIVQLKIEDHVLLLGMRTDVEELMQGMDMLLFPSRFEGFSIVIIEAQCSGLPIVASDVLPEETRLTDCIHYLSIEHEDVNTWADKMKNLLGNYKREDKSNDIRKAGYDISECARVLSDVLKNI